MSVYTVGICDDSREFNKSMTALCEEVLTKLKLTYEIKNYFCEEDVIRDFARGGGTDLLFLDIMLGRKNGIDLAKKLKERGDETAVVLMTVDSSFLLEGYSVQPIYFIMKPVSAEEIERAIKIDMNRRIRSKSIYLKCDKKHVPIPVDSITYVEVIDHAITVHTRSQDYVTRMTFGELLHDLPQSRFARCHNSFAVNLARVSHFSRSQGVTLDCRVTLPIGRKYFTKFRQNFVDFIDMY